MHHSTQHQKYTWIGSLVKFQFNYHLGFLQIRLSHKSLNNGHQACAPWAVSLPGCHITLAVAQKISEKNDRALVYFFSPGLIQGKSNKNSIEGTVSDLPTNKCMCQILGRFGPDWLRYVAGKLQAASMNYFLIADHFHVFYLITYFVSYTSWCDDQPVWYVIWTQSFINIIWIRKFPDY